MNHPELDLSKLKDLLKFDLLPTRIVFCQVHIGRSNLTGRSIPFNPILRNWRWIEPLGIAARSKKGPRQIFFLDGGRFQKVGGFGMIWISLAFIGEPLSSGSCEDLILKSFGLDMSGMSMCVEALLAEALASEADSHRHMNTKYKPKPPRFATTVCHTYDK